MNDNAKEKAIFANGVDWLSRVAETNGMDSVGVFGMASELQGDFYNKLSEIMGGSSFHFDIGNRYGLWGSKFNENRNISLYFNIYLVTPETLTKLAKDTKNEAGCYTLSELKPYLNSSYLVNPSDEINDVVKQVLLNSPLVSHSVDLNLIREENTPAFLDQFLKLVMFKVDMKNDFDFRSFFYFNDESELYKRYIDVVMFSSVDIPGAGYSPNPLNDAVDAAYDDYISILEDMLEEQTMNNEIILKDNEIETKETLSESLVSDNVKLPVVINGEEYTDSKELGTINIKLKLRDKEFNPIFVDFNDIPFPLKHFDFSNNLPDDIFKVYVDRCVAPGLRYSLSHIFEDSNIFFGSVYEMADNVFGVNMSSMSCIDELKQRDKDEILKTFKRSVDLYIKYYKDYKEPVTEVKSEGLSER